MSHPLDRPLTARFAPAMLLATGSVLLLGCLAGDRSDAANADWTLTLLYAADERSL